MNSRCPQWASVPTVSLKTTTMMTVMMMMMTTTTMMFGDCRRSIPAAEGWIFWAEKLLSFVRFSVRTYRRDDGPVNGEYFQTT
jgi:hypothetical protein